VSVDALGELGGSIGIEVAVARGAGPFAQAVNAAVTASGTANPNMTERHKL